MAKKQLPKLAWQIREDLDHHYREITHALQSMDRQRSLRGAAE